MRYRMHFQITENKKNINVGVEYFACYQSLPTPLIYPYCFLSKLGEWNLQKPDLTMRGLLLDVVV
jgi:hypothetical protein